MYRETVAHLLWECNEGKKLWSLFVKWFNYIHKLNIQLNRDTVILNNYRCDSLSMAELEYVNLCILITKQYIYAQKCLGNTLKCDQLIAKIFEINVIENVIASRTNATVKYNLKWKLFIENCLMIKH